MQHLYMSDDLNKVIDIVSRFGCLDMAQLYLLMPTRKPEMINRTIIKLLVKDEQIEIVKGHYIQRFKDPKAYNHDVINAIWVMLKLCGGEDAMDSCMRGQKPALIYCTSENKRAFEIIPVNESKLIALRSAQERYTTIDEKFGLMCANFPVFVVTGDSVIEKIKDMEFTFSFLVAKVTYAPGSDVPKIEIFKS